MLVAVNSARMKSAGSHRPQADLPARQQPKHDAPRAVLPLCLVWWRSLLINLHSSTPAPNKSQQRHQDSEVRHGILFPREAQRLAFSRLSYSFISDS